MGHLRRARPRSGAYPCAQAGVAVVDAAAALPLAGLTAWQTLTRVLAVGKDDVVLVHAAAGGVGSFAVQLAQVLGARVIGTASEANHDYLRALGAEPVAYGDGLVERVRSMAPQGVTAVLDLVGGDALESSSQLLADGGRLASVTDAARVRELGGRYWFVRPDSVELTTLSRLVTTVAWTCTSKARFLWRRRATPTAL